MLSSVSLCYLKLYHVILCFSHCCTEVTLTEITSSRIDPGEAQGTLFCLYLVSSWLLAFASGQKVGLFSGDVSGAFDNVDSARLCSKLRLLGIFRRIVDVIDSWLQPRTARVVLDGSASDEIGMTNMVYQGTVWGPCLWNCYFADA